MTPTPTPAVVVLSGGQDSTTCLYAALDPKEQREVRACIFFDYGQLHRESEYACAREICDSLSIPLKSVKLDALAAVSRTGLIAKSELAEISADVEVGEAVNTPHPLFPDLPVSFVPGRNLVMLTLAAAYAASLGAQELWTGVCQTDYSGYPDCRRETIDALETAIALGFGVPFEIVTPLMYLTKAETFALAAGLGCLATVVYKTHTGYTGSREHLYPWGWGPAEGEPLDPASELRRRGFDEYLGALPPMERAMVEGLLGEARENLGI